MKIKLIIIILLISFKTLACECMELHEENINEFKESVDFIFIGTVMNHNRMNENEYYDRLWETNEESYEIIVKVERVIKGEIKSDFVYITQTLSGNCSRLFKKGEKYVFSGYHIRKFIDLTPEAVKGKSISSIKDSLSIPIVERDKTIKPDHNYENKTIYLTNIEFDFESWNKIAKQQTLIHTDGCISNTLTSKFGKLLTSN